MFVASLALCLFSALTSDSEVKTLVAQLGSPRYAEREAAALALQKLGDQALPVLRIAREAKDPEVRNRAATLVDKIESDLITQPTLVRLDFKDAPLTDVVKQIGEQSKVNVILFPENDNQLTKRKITLKHDKPVSFFRAMDELCRVGQLFHNPNMGMPAGKGPTFQLQNGTMGPGAPASDNGPFRVNLVSLHHHEDLQLNMGQGQVVFNGQFPKPPGGAAPKNATVEQFYIQMQVMAEPRLMLTQNGQLKLVEALDDKGQSLLQPAVNNPFQHNSGYFGYNQGQVIQLQQHLKWPENPGKSIKKLKGVIPVTVAARKPGPLEIPLKDSNGKVFKNSTVTITIHDVKAQPNQPGTLIELSIKPNSGQAEAIGGAAPFQGDFGFQPQNNPQNQIEIVDAQGKSSQWFPQNTRNENNQLRMTIQWWPNDGAVVPTHLRYFDLSRASSEVAFEFNDVPMPGNR